MMDTHTGLKPTPLRRQVLNDLAHGRIIHAHGGKARYEQLYEGVPGPLSKTAEATVKELWQHGLVHHKGKLPGEPVALTLDGKMTWARWCQ